MGDISGREDSNVHCQLFQEDRSSARCKIGERENGKGYSIYHMWKHQDCGFTVARSRGAWVRNLSYGLVPGRWSVCPYVHMSVSEAESLRG